MRFSTALYPVAVAAVLAACSDQHPTITEVATTPAPQFSGIQTHAIELVAVVGTGYGAVNVTPTAEDQGTFHVQGQVHIRGAAPNTQYLVQRAPDLNVADPACTGPWISFPVPNAGPIVTLTTSPAGAGAAHFELGVGGAFTSGTPFNVRFRVIDDLANPTSVLMSDCVTVVVK
ncbi:hypothetical protein [Piscinibacter sp.]|uniref:hypothetical protein n=1 Tax=Piscinibacter sp. TaxID=1903157 RepID=UPI002CCD08D1|nr:hypothetical protein [Albitalea sp.]HUG22426.1 hypothetical protein [Albitalea sp.]